MKAKLLAMLLLIGLTSVEAAGQSVPARKDIPSIAKSANGSIVSIVMSDDKGKPIAQGSGFLVSMDGLVLTNYHVIAEGSSAVVKLPDGAFYAVDGVIASDKARDIAVIKAHGTNFRTLTLGNSDRLQVGQEVVAIGNPISLESTVSNGIISGIRVIKEGKYLQITAPISHGSSGGPLFNMFGEVVGITAAIIESGENLNFAIPINAAKPLLLSESLKLQALPNEPEKVEAETSHTMPDLKTTAEFMDRIVEPEDRKILLGVLQGAELHSRTSRSLTIVSNRYILLVVPTATTLANGYPEFTYSTVSEYGKREQQDYPRYMSFALGDIDPSSITSKEGGYDLYVLSEFWEKHPKCEANPQCADEYLSFLGSAPKLTVVEFHTTDLKPLIELGGCTPKTGCAPSGTAKSVLIFFKGKERAERFVTALIRAVKLEGGKPDLFPPTH